MVAGTQVRRRPRPWNPQDVLDLATDEHIDWQKATTALTPIPLANVQRKEFSIGSHAGINRGWASQDVLESFWAWWYATEEKYGYTKARQLTLEKVKAEQDTLFNPPAPAFTWQDVSLASYKWYQDKEDDWVADKLDSHWEPRAYQLGGVRFVRNYVHHSGGKYRDGHGNYFNMHAGGKWEYCLFSELGGNALQLVNREDVFKKNLPAIDNRQAAGGPIEILGCVFLNTGYSDGRGSYPISIMGLGRPGRLFPVTIENGLIRCRWPDHLRDNEGHRSRGGILVESRGQDQCLNGDVVVRNVHVELWNPDRQLLAINNAESVLIEGCTFQANEGPRWVDIDRNDFDDFDNVMPCKRVVIKDCGGNGLVRVRDQHAYPVTEDMVIENGVRVS